MRVLYSQIWFILSHKSFLWLLLLINLFGTVYGYDWYMWQLEVTEPKFWIFVPDSPTATLFFCIAIIGWLIKKHFKLMEALALITLVKYGLWAVVMNFLTLIETGYLHWTGWMLVASHFLMAVQGVLYLPKYRFSTWHIAIAAVWTLHNDVIDYVFGQMPIYHDIMKYSPQIGYFTFWLSIACIGIAIWSYRSRQHLEG